MVRRARAQDAEPSVEPRTEHSWIWLALIGVIGGGDVGAARHRRGLIAVPVLLYVGRLPVKMVAPTALAGVCLTTLSCGLGYLTAVRGRRCPAGWPDIWT